MAISGNVIQLIIRLTDQVSGKLNNIGGSLQRFGSVVKLTGALLAAKQFTDYADILTNLQNRLKLVTESTTDLKSTQEELFRSAQRTRTSFETTVNLYSRIARSAQQLGVEQGRLFKVTETVNQAIQISGATTQEAAAGVIQFAQGLASGRLGGEELRSVLEQMPRLATAIADGLGVGIGKLRQLGTEGRLTAEVVLGAIERQAPLIASEFDKTTSTVGQASTKMGNSLLRLLGRFNEASGASGGLATSISGLADTLSSPEVTGRVQAFGELIGNIARGAGELNRETTGFFDGIKKSASDAAASVDKAMGDKLGSFWDQLKTGARAGRDAVASQIPFLDLFRGIEQRGADLAAEEALQPVEVTAQRILPTVQKLEESIEEVLVTARKIEVEGLPALLRTFEEETRTVAERTGRDFEVLRIKLDELQRAGIISAEQYAKRLKEALDDALEEVDINDVKRLRLDEPLTAAQKKVQNFTDTLKDGLRAAADDGKLSINDLVRYIIAQLVKRELYAAIDRLGIYLNRALSGTSSTSTATSGAKGGFLGALGSAFGAFLGGRAGGGLFSGPTKVGETGLEVVGGAGRVWNTQQLIAAMRSGGGMGGGVVYSPKTDIHVAGSADQETLARMEIMIARSEQRQQRQLMQTFERNNMRPLR